jgi:lipid-binding SYLF domain-containing protein
MQQTGTEQSFRWVRRDMLALLLGVAIVPGCFRVAEAATAAEINKDADAAIKQLEAQDPNYRALLQKALGVLIFPKIIKGGLIIGGEYGEGALRENGKTVRYYSIAAASLGLQAGGQSFSYALLFMKQAALDFCTRATAGRSAPGRAWSSWTREWPQA